MWWFEDWAQLLTMSVGKELRAARCCIESGCAVAKESQGLMRE